MFQNTWATSGFTCHWLAKAGSSVIHLLGSLWCPCWLPRVAWPEMEPHSPRVGAWSSGWGQALGRLPLPLRDPRWLSHLRAVLRWAPAKGDPGSAGGKCAGTLLDLSPSSRQVFSGPNTGSPRGGRAPPTGTSSQLSPQAASSMTSQTKPSEMHTGHLPAP